MLMFLHESFLAFNEVVTAEGSNWEACKVKLQQLTEQWQQKGLFGANALDAITRYQEHINWKGMSPEQFGRFYRFVFYICREPGKRNILMDLAVAAWGLIMPGRFRLLDRWCAFAATSSARVVTEDTWRQVLEFSRTIHEDLSNYDSAGAWAVLLDEFVDDLRASSRRRPSYAASNDGATRLLYGSGGSGGGPDLHQLARRASSGAELAALFAGTGGGELGGGGGSGSICVGGLADGGLGLGLGLSLMARISPRCGSKRREPDVDGVAEQLSAMPLGAEHRQHHQQCGPRTGGGETPGQAMGFGMDCCGGMPYGGYGAGAQVKRQCADSFNAALGHHSFLPPPESLQAGAYQSEPRQLPQGPQPRLHTQQQPVQLFPQHHHHQQQPPLQVHRLQLQCGGLGPPPGAAAGVLEGCCPGFPSVGLGRSASAGQLMSCSAVSGPGNSNRQEPMIAASMEFLRDTMTDGGLGAPHLQHAQQQQQMVLLQQMQHQQQQHCQQQRRAIKARRSGLSDIVKSAVSDALGF